MQAVKRTLVELMDLQNRLAALDIVVRQARLVNCCSALIHCSSISLRFPTLKFALHHHVLAALTQCM